MFLNIILIFSFYILKGFREIAEIQGATTSRVGKERKQMAREREIILSVLDAEISENKTKVNAYVMIHEEILADLKNEKKTPKYQKTGDMVQKQPALSRVAFDENKNKLDLFDEKVASLMIHYYARIKTIPDYADLKPDMPIEEAVRIVDNALDNARKLESISEAILEMFLQMRRMNKEKSGSLV
jgi:hypothetical protein